MSLYSEKQGKSSKKEEKKKSNIKTWNIPSSSLIVGIEGACEAGVGRVDTVAGVFWGVGAAARSSTRLFLMNCFSDMAK